MALYHDLPVFKDVYKLIIKLFEYTKDFPREYKYTLGQDIKRDGIRLVRSIYRSNKEKDKRAYLESFLDDFEILKLVIRICRDMQILSLKKQAELSILMDSIGKQIIGWRNAQKNYRAILNQNEITKKAKPTIEEQVRFQSSINSYLGIMKHYNTYGLRKKMLWKHLNPYWWNVVYLSGGYAKFVRKERKVSGK